MTSLFFKLIILVFITGCTSTHIVLTYKTVCFENEKKIFSNIDEFAFKFLESTEKDNIVCKRQYSEHTINRKGIVIEHLDGRKFKFDEIEQLVYLHYDQSKCELTVVAPLNGKTPDTEGESYILDRYFMTPFLQRIKGLKSIDQGKPNYANSINLSSQKDFQEYCR